MTETVTRLRATTTTNRYSDTERDWSNPDELAIDGCAVAPRDSPETPGDNRDGIIIGFTVYAPEGADVTATDRLRVRGDDYDVDGEPAVWVNPWTSVEEGVEIRTRVVNG